VKLDPARYARLSALLDEALELDASARAALLDALRGEDATLAAELAALLAADAAPQPLIDAPLVLPLTAGTSMHVAGERVGPFRLVRELGRGGMGVVWLAERDDREVRQQVALKLIHPELDSAFARHRLRRERAILARLEHPHIAHLVDVGVDARGSPWLALEYVSGEPITDHATRRRLPLARRIGLLIDVCRAVQFAHARLIVHHDLKPSNVFVDAHGAVKLLDFGVAALLDPAADAGDAAGPGVASGVTPAYAAPEQLRGEPATVASDIYALGLVLFELLTEARPWPPGQRPRDPAQAPPQASRMVDAARRRALRGDLDAILAKALAPRAADRYASAETLAEDLQRHLTRHPVLAHRTSRGYRARKFLQRHRLGSLAALAIAAAVLVGAAAALWQARIANRQAQRAEAVRNLLVSMFSIADPDLNRGREVTAAELLGEAARRAALAPGSDPLLAADIDATLGTLARRIGDYPTAQQRLRAAEAALAGAGDAAAPALLQVRLDLADALRLNGDPKAARELLAGLAAQLARTPPPVHAQALATQARVLAQLGELEQAERDANAALKLDEASGGAAAIVRDRNILADLSYARGDFAGAVQRFEQVLAAQRALHGDTHTAVAQAQQDLGVALAGAGRYDEAIAALASAHALYVRLLGTEHPAVASVLVNWGGALRQSGQLDAAEPKYRAALALDEKQLGADHPQTLLALNSLATVLTQRNRDAEAQALFERVLAGNRRVLGERNGQLVPTLISLGGLAFRRGDYAGAVARYREALAIADAALGPGNPTSDIARRGLGYTLAMSGDPDAGLPLLREAWEHHRARHGERHPEVIIFGSSLAQVLAGTGKLDEAWALARSTHAAALAILPAQHPFRAHAGVVLARIELLRGDLDAAGALVADLRAAHAVDYAAHAAAELELLDLQVRAARGDRDARMQLRERGAALRAQLPPLLRTQR